MNKAKANYWVDTAIGVAGLASAISGLVFLLPGDPTTGVLGISYQVWNSLHTWSSLIAIAGVGAHMALHWKWMVAMTRQLFSTTKQPKVGESIPALASGDAASPGLSRRAFLMLGGAAAVVAGVAVAGYKVLFDTSTAEAGSIANQPAVTDQEGGVACPYGLVNDPYPGRCKHYVDSNGDGICDYSVPGSGSSVASSGEGGFSGSFRHRPGFGQPEAGR